MKLIRFALFIFILIYSIPLSSQTRLDWSIIYKLTNTNNITIYDVPGHVIGSAEGTGLGFFEDKSAAVMSGSFIYDYVDGSGNFYAYYSFSFEDGSGFTVKTINATAEYNSKVERTVFEGGIEFVSGKGKYIGIKGSGSIKGKRTQNIENGAAVYLDISSNYELNK